MSRDDRAASLLYGGRAPSGSGTPARSGASLSPFPAPTQATPASPTESTPRDPVALFYSADSAFKTLFQRHRSALYDAGVSTADLARQEAAFVEIVRTHGFDHAAAATFYEAWATATVRDARNPSSALAVLDESRAWDMETRQQLRQAHGAERADRIFADVEQFVAGVPELRDVFAVGAIGMRPDIFGLMVDYVQRHPEVVPRATAADPDPASAATTVATTPLTTE